MTEQVTGLDLVEWQIRIAQGEKLPFEQAAIQVTGWAVEARINCEDPAHGYRPELGTVGRYIEPNGAGIRTDSGIASGSEIPPQYDSMVAKLIGSGATRARRSIVCAMHCAPSRRPASAPTRHCCRRSSITRSFVLAG